MARVASSSPVAATTARVLTWWSLRIVGLVYVATPLLPLAGMRLRNLPLRLVADAVGFALMVLLYRPLAPGDPLVALALVPLALALRDFELLRDRLTSCIGCGCLSLKTCKLLNRDDAVAANGPGARYLLGDEQ